MSQHRFAAPARRDRVLRAFLLVIAVAAGGLLAGCGDSSNGVSAQASTSPSAGSVPSPVPSPYATSWPPPAGAVDVVHRFWDMVGDGRLRQAQQTLVAPRSSLLAWDGKDIASARYVGLVPNSVAKGPYGKATTAFAVTVWVEPTEGGGPWGQAAEHTLFEQVVRMSDGTWRMWSSGTGP